jgi:predicted kinase
LLISLAGLPGTGKSTIARALAERIGAVWLRVDTIEQALGGIKGPEGYLVGYALAGDNLRVGRTVIADSVNPLAITRDAWRDVARNAGVPCIEVEVVCSDETEHRRRIETRMSDIEGHKLPTWADVVARDYTAWDRPRIVLDTATRPVAGIVADLAAQLGPEG